MESFYHLFVNFFMEAIFFHFLLTFSLLEMGTERLFYLPKLKVLFRFSNIGSIHC